MACCLTNKWFTCPQYSYEWLCLFIKCEFTASASIVQLVNYVVSPNLLDYKISAFYSQLYSHE